MVKYTGLKKKLVSRLVTMCQKCVDSGKHPRCKNLKHFRKGQNALEGFLPPRTAHKHAEAQKRQVVQREAQDEGGDADADADAGTGEKGAGAAGET